MLGIKEGTDEETLNKNIGHFEETSLCKGNICLAAHNRGYEENYFARLKELKNNDIIYYFYNNEIKKYKVIESLIIYETDWAMLENTEDNRITLITCVENREEYRLCVQAKEV